MKKTILFLFATLMVVFTMSACTNRQVGTVTGGVIGGVAGNAITGGSAGGTIVGAAGGAIIGNQLSQ